MPALPRRGQESQHRDHPDTQALQPGPHGEVGGRIPDGNLEEDVQQRLPPHQQRARVQGRSSDARREPWPSRRRSGRWEWTPVPRSAPEPEDGRRSRRAGSGRRSRGWRRPEGRARPAPGPGNRSPTSGKSTSRMASSGTRTRSRRRPPSGFTKTWATTSAGISWARAGVGAPRRTPPRSLRLRSGFRHEGAGPRCFVPPPG